MKTKRLFIYCLLAGAFILASCSSEEMTDNQVEALPDGMYPLTFTATQGEVVATPQTRVSDSDVAGQHKSSWTAGDQIKVKVSDNNGNNMETICTLDAGGNITAYNPQLYWQTTGNYTINAWYSNITGQNTTSGTVTLTKQSSGLAYVLKTGQLTNQNYKNGDIALTFKHQLAKVRVKLTGDKATAVTGVKVKGYTTCTVTDGKVSNEGNETYFSMRKNGDYYEANLVPKTINSNDFIRLNENVQATVTGITKLEAGNVYTITIEVKPVSITDGRTITEPGDYLMNGSYSQTITIQKGEKVTLTLNNVESTAGTAIKVESGSPTIIVQGENSFTHNGLPIVIHLDGKDANVILQGGKEGGKLSVTAGGNNAAASAIIGGAANAEAGNITIRDMKISITGINNMKAAVIGTGIGFEAKASCGDIYMENTILNVDGTVSSAVIGAGLAQNHNTSCGNITIKLNKDDTKTAFLSRLPTPSYSTAEKVGKGVSVSNDSNVSSSSGTVTWKDANDNQVN